MKYLKEIFSDESNRPSSNRIIGFLIVVCGLVMSFFDMKNGKGTLEIGVYLLLGGQVKSMGVKGIGDGVKAFFQSSTTSTTTTTAKVAGGPPTATGPSVTATKTTGGTNATTT